MLIVLEGPDGAGKTTLANRLIHTFLENSKADSAELIHRGPLDPAIDPLHEYLLSLKYNRRDYNHLVVLDRWHVSEMVYGPIYRGASRLNQFRWVYIEKWLEAQGALRLVVTAPTRILRARVEERGDDYIDIDDLDRINSGFFRWQAAHPSWTLVNTGSKRRPQVNRLHYRARLLQESVRRLNEIPTYVGPAKPSILMTADFDLVPTTENDRAVKLLSTASDPRIGLMGSEHVTAGILTRLGHPHVLRVNEEGEAHDW